jgi:phosphate transport system substrate-binding protein
LEAITAPTLARLVVLLFLGVTGASPPAAAVLRINGSTTVNLPVAEAAEILRSEKGLEIQVDAHGGSAGGISALGDGLAEVAMSSKPLSDTDRARYPSTRFHATRIGEDAVALVVSRDLWDAGVRSLARQQVRDIYEGRVRNWRAVSGPDRRLVFFNKEPGRGTWEVFVAWLYGDPKRVPPVTFLEVGGNEETRNKVSSTRGAISQLSASWADGRRVFALGIEGADGRIIYPTRENIAAGIYPMSRPLLLLTDGEPAGEAALLVRFLLSERGQALVRKHGYLSLDQITSNPADHQ